MSTPDTRIPVTPPAQQRDAAPSVLPCDGPCGRSHDPGAMCGWCLMCRSHAVDGEIVQEGCCTCELDFDGGAALWVSSQP